ncbi:hypothetical protein, partial [Paralimibaculum aggregatum]|uniref:hypothetical protein n=1 Tax=Paralimibaculum aggregatum TaxID=3036245 RepID=UPI002555E34E
QTLEIAGDDDGGEPTNPGPFFVDFTDESVWSTADGLPVTIFDYLGSGIDITITGINGAGANQLNFDDEVAIPGASIFEPGGPFAGDTDGAGIGGFNFDEVDGEEMLIIDFSAPVEITDVFVLDMFINLNAPEEEGATAVYDDAVHDYLPRMGEFDINPPGGNGFGSFDLSDDPYDVQSGSAGNQVTRQIVFTALGGNDGAGVGDFALAGLEFNLAEVEPPTKGREP